LARGDRFLMRAALGVERFLAGPRVGFTLPIQLFLGLNPERSVPLLLGHLGGLGVAWTGNVSQCTLVCRHEKGPA
jgi:hypothetical protein